MGEAKRRRATDSSYGKEDDILGRYRILMREILERIDAFNIVLGPTTKLSKSMKMEFCILQFRMVCELLALACLTAHGDLKGADTTVLMKEYSADRIMGALEKLHKDFFPIAIVDKGKDISGVRDFVLLTNGERISQKELIHLYNRSGAYLHKGSMKRLMGQAMSGPEEFPDVANWMQKIYDLLGHHFVARIGTPLQMVCTLRTVESNDVQVVMLQAGRPRR